MQSNFPETNGNVEWVWSGDCSQAATRGCSAVAQLPQYLAEVGDNC